MWKVTVYVTDAKGTRHTIIVPTDGSDSIVDLAEKQGLELPYSCRSGACYSCCATVNSGKEFLEQNKTGEQLIDVEPDEFLCCIWWIKPDAFVDSAEAPQWRVIDLTMLN